MEQSADQVPASPIIEELLGAECVWCELGELALEAYKGDTAVVCDNCGTPAARVW